MSHHWCPCDEEAQLIAVLPYVQTTLKIHHLNPLILAAADTDHKGGFTRAAMHCRQHLARAL